jgi:hypothetical protein
MAKAKRMIQVSHFSREGFHRLILDRLPKRRSGEPMT